MKHIGIVCEGPTDYIILKGVIDQITGMGTDGKAFGNGVMIMHPFAKN